MAKVEPSAIVKAARSFVGTPYHHQGRVKGVGVDCVGLIFGVASAVGIEIADKPLFLRYKRRPPVGRGLLDHLDEQCQQVEKYRPGDILVFWINHVNRRAQHLGFAGVETLIHTHSAIHFVIEQPLDEYWQHRFITAYRLPGVK